MKRCLALCLGACLLLPACVKVDNSLGAGLVDKSLLFDTYTAAFPLEEICLKLSEDLSGYSTSHVTIGAIRDADFGLTTREAAFPLIPALDTIDLGSNPVPVSFYLCFEADTVSCPNGREARILQNLYVTELTAPLPQANTSTNWSAPHGTELLTDGIPVYSGEEDLRITFTKAYAQKYIDAIRALGPVFKERTDDDDDSGIDRYDAFVEALPGIHIATDAPEGEGGRINLFNLSCLSVYSSQYYRNNNLAYLKVHSSWDGVEKDSTFLFIPGEAELVDEVDYLDNNTKFYQYSFNHTGHDTVAEDHPAAALLVEGGGGLKPVIPARELREKTRRAILAQGGDPDKAVIVKASIILPFEMPGDYNALDYFPSMLSPTIRTETAAGDGEAATIAFAGLTDASVSSENQGDIDRSNLRYAPDITYHLQELLSRTDLDTATDGDIWLLIIHVQKEANASGSLADNSYYQQLLYASYYNSLYGGYGGYGYGSYGYSGYGYGSYGYGSNYYSYLMLAQMMSAYNQQTYSYNTELDKDRFYKAVLNGTDAANAPHFQVSFSIPKN